MSQQPARRALRLTPQGAGVPAPVNPDRLIDGQPHPQVWNAYTDPTEQFYAGQWAAGVGRWRVVYAPHEEEFCVLIDGEVLLIDDDGNELHLHAGDAFVVPGGYRGIWCNLTPVRKHYTIMNLTGTPE